MALVSVWLAVGQSGLSKLCIAVGVAVAFPIISRSSEFGSHEMSRCDPAPKQKRSEATPNSVSLKNERFPSCSPILFVRCCSAVSVIRELVAPTGQL